MSMIAERTEQRPPLGIPAGPTCSGGRDLALYLWDFMQVAADRMPGEWLQADQVAFARSVVPLLSRWESEDADEYFAAHLPGYADAETENDLLYQEPAMANVGLDEDAAAWDAEIAESPDAGFETFDGSDLQQELSRG